MSKEKVAVLGAYSYSHLVGLKVFSDSDFVFCQKIEDIYDSVENGNADFGVAPIENLIHGSVRESIRSLSKCKVKIVHAYDYPIHHCLASLSSEFSKIISHPQALGQCSEFLSSHKDKKIEETTSTSKAMELASKNKEYAAVGSLEAAKHFNLRVLKEKIEDNHDNETRFFLISKSSESHEGKKTRTSIIITPHEDKPGVLFEILKIFKERNLNLTKIESIPLGRRIGEYQFFIEISGSESESSISSAEKELASFNNLISLGSYPLEVL